MRFFWHRFAFTIVNVLQVSLLNAAGPRLLAPEDGTFDQPRNVTLVWEAGSPTNRIRNGGFEQGFTAWSSIFPWRASTFTNAAEGLRVAEIRPEESTFIAGEAFLLQEVAMPAQGAGARLSWVDFKSGVASPLARFKVEVAPIFGTPAVVHDMTVGPNPDDSWEYHEVNLTSYVGRRITVSFVLSNPLRENCRVRLDAVRLEVTPARVSYEVYLGRQSVLGVAELIASTVGTTWPLTGLEGGSTNYWKIDQISDGLRETSPVYRFAVARLLPPLLTLAAHGNSGEVRFSTHPGVRYQVEAADQLDPPTWQPLAASIPGDGLEAVVPVRFDVARRFWRVVVSP